MEMPLIHPYSGGPGAAMEFRGPRRKRILLADDHSSVRKTISILLKFDEHIVVETINGAEALEVFQRDQFDLVITDFDMPQMKGDELALHIKQGSPSQPILMITAFAGQLERYNIPVDAILEKPFRLEDLRRVMAQLIS
jgi:CheY-like chemotaxis protein